MRSLATLLATEAEGGSLSFGEQFRGYLVVIFAVGLFCGSIYLLLATDVGKRLGFLISLSTLFGFLAMLGIIWFTNLTPLNALHGPAPKWKVTDVVEKVEENPTAQKVEASGTAIDAVAQGEIKASLDTAVTTEGSEFFKFQSATAYVSIDAKEIGGGNKFPFRHKAHYAVMQIQEVVSVTPLPGQAPPPPKADPTKPIYSVVFQRDLGALRQPPLFMSIGFSILFVITLVLLHKGERAKQLAEREGTAIEPAPAMA